LVKRPKKPNVRTPQAAPPGNTATIQEVFSSDEEMADAVDAIARFFNKRYSKADSEEQVDARGFTIKRIRVVFTADVKRVEFESDFAKSLGIIYAPVIPGASEQTIDARNDELIRYFSTITKDSQIQMAIRLYQSLDTEARDRLREKYSSDGNKQASSKTGEARGEDGSDS
jgi:hypothetical protein